MAEVNSFGAIKVLMMVTFSKTISMVLVSTNGPTVEFSREIG